MAKQLIAVIGTLIYWFWTGYDAINAWFDQFGIVGKIIKFVALGPLFWLVTAIKEASSWMKKLGLISDETVEKTSKFADLKSDLQAGGGDFKADIEQRRVVEGMNPGRIESFNKSRLDGTIEIRDRGNNVQKSSSKFSGLGNLGMTAAGA